MPWDGMGTNQRLLSEIWYDRDLFNQMPFRLNFTILQRRPILISATRRGANLLARLNAFDEESKRAKPMYAHKGIQNDLLKEALGENGEAIPVQRYGRKGSVLSMRQHSVGVPCVQHQ